MFCKNCGTEITGSAKFCSECGGFLFDASPQTSAQTPKLSMYDFLALNAEYQKAATSFDKKETRFGTLATVLILATVALIVLLGATVEFHGWFPWFAMFLYIVVAMVVLLVIVSREQKLKREFEHYGAKLYEEYLKQ